MYTKKQKICAALMCTVFVMVTLFSTLFIVKEAGHDCAGKDCTVCECIRQAEQTLEQLGNGKPEPEAPGVSGPTFILFALVFPCGFLFALCVTLQNWKVRLDN